MIIQNSFAGINPIYICERCHKALSNPISIKAGMGPICRGHHGKGNDMPKKEKQFDMTEWGDRFDFEIENHQQAHCYIKINNNVVICTESPENHGISITNAAEDIATQVCRAYGIPMDQLQWIEHYVNLSDTFSDEENGETWDFATFVVEDGFRGGKCLAHPKWKHAGREKALAVFEGRDHVV